MRRPPPVLVHSQPEYLDKKILDSKWPGRQQAYGPEKSWEPARYIHADCFIRAFHAANRDKHRIKGILDLPEEGGNVPNSRSSPILFSSTY